MRIAILDLYEGQPNQGMRCIRQIINEWSEFHSIETSFDEFDVRKENQVPDLSFPTVKCYLVITTVNNIKRIP